MRVAVVHSGTSADAIDVALVDIVTDERAGVTDMTPLVLTDIPWPSDLRDRVLAIALGEPVSIAEVARLDVQIGEAFADAVIRAGCHEADLVVAPGQTVYHWVEGGRTRGTLQLGRSAVIAERTGAAVVSDLRAADIAAGGTGAPLMPVFDGAWLGAEAAHSGEAIATLNLGGIANISRITPVGSASGWDTGPANGLLDAVVMRATSGRESFDDDGYRAASGRVNRHLLQIMEGHPYFAQAPPKSTGRETFALDFVDAAVHTLGGDVPVDDLLATLVRLTARTVAESLRRAGGASTLIASGGGVRNSALMASMGDALAEDGCTLTTSVERGIDPLHKESLLFAFVGYFSAHAIPIALDPKVGPRVAGVTTPAGWAANTRVSSIGEMQIRERHMK